MSASSEQIKVIICSETGIDGTLLKDLKEWFDRHPGPIALEKPRGGLSLPLDSDGELPWAAGFEYLRHLRSVTGAGPADFVILLTKSPNENNWFCVNDPNSPRNAFAHVDDFSWILPSPPHVFAAQWVLESVFDGLLTEHGLRLEDVAHETPRGCFADLCGSKEDLRLKMKTGDICGDCIGLMQSTGLPEGLIEQAARLLQSTRATAINVSSYLETARNFDGWPFPVAVTRHKAIQATEPIQRFFLLLDHFDSLIRYFYLSHQILGGSQPVIAAKPSLGTWLGYLASSTGLEPDFRQIVRIAESEKIVQLRNERRGHGYVSMQAESYEHESKQLEIALAQIEEKLALHFSNHQLVYIKSVALEEGGDRVKGDKLVSSHLIHPSFTAKVGNAREAGVEAEKRVYLYTPRTKKFRSIHPHICVDNCPLCNHSRVLVTDGENRYIDVFIGHRIEKK